MPKALIAVVTCEKFKERANIQRETWVPLAKNIDVRFFLARQDREPLPDEVFLDAPDDYHSLPFKVKAAYRWALDHGYFNVFKTDDDTYIWPDRLAAAVPSRDYVGFKNATPPKPWCSGFGYWLSEKALRLVADAEIPEGEWAEDRWVGSVLHKHGIHPAHDPRYALILKQQWKIHDLRTVIAACDCRTPSLPMREFHRAVLANQPLPSPS